MIAPTTQFFCWAGLTLTLSNSRLQVQSLGFVNTTIANPTFDELKVELERGLYPIIYVKAQLSPDKPPQKHALVVVGIDENSVEIRDPWRGELVLSQAAFQTEWESARRVTILIEK